MTLTGRRRVYHGTGLMRWWGAVCVLAVLLPGLAYGESEMATFQARDVVKKGTWEIGGLVGNLEGLAVLTSSSANRNALYILPRAGLVLTDELGSGLAAGNLELMVEPLVAHYFKPFSATAAGGSVVFKYNFLSFGRWMPYWNVGLGMLWTDLAPRIAEQSTPFNFVVRSGPGVSYFWTDKIATTFEADFHHISDAGMGDRNLGLNSILLSVGISIMLPE